MTFDLKNEWNVHSNDWIDEVMFLSYYLVASSINDYRNEGIGKMLTLGE